MNNSSPVVSVVMPTYNRASLLPDVIASILEQDFEGLELIIIDDGSTDDTETVVAKYCEQDPRMRYIQLPQNRGLGFARSTGLRYFKGEYIALADSDDIWMAGRLSLQVELLAKYPRIDILFGNFLDIDHVKNTKFLGISEDKKVFQQFKARLLESESYEIVSGLESALLVSNFIAAPTMVLRRKVFDFIGGFNESLAATDLEFCWRAALLGARFAYLDRPLIERHLRADSMTSQGDRPWLQRFDAIKEMYLISKTTKRLDMLKYIRGTEVRTYRNLLRIYGEQSRPFQVIYTYLRSLKCGFSFRTFALFIVASFGSKAIGLAERFNRNGK